MANLTPVIVPAKALKGGKHKIRISVAHNGETRYIVTDIIIDNAKEFKNGVIVKRADANMLNTKLRGIMQKYQSAVDGIQYLSGLTCAELVTIIKNFGVRKPLTLQTAAEEYLANSLACEATIGVYRGALKRIFKYIDGNVMLEHVTHATILQLTKTLDKSKFKVSTKVFSLNLLSSVLNYAQRCDYVQYRINPFIGIHLDKPEPRQSWLTVEEIRIIRDIEIKPKRCNSPILKCRDMFMLSYYLGGINIADLVNINFNEFENKIRYIREKTKRKPKINKYVEFDIPVEAKEIINRYKDNDGLFSLTASQRKDKCKNFIKTQMDAISKLTGIKNLVYYSARKSFSQHAFDLGINNSVIDYILGHNIGKGGSSLFSYIFVTPEMATEAVRKVLDNLK